MLIPDNETPKQPNEKLSWRTFRYCAISYRYPQDEGLLDDNPQSILWGTIETDRKMRQTQLTQLVMTTLAMRAGMVDLPWNCFNLNLCIKAVEAHEGPEQ